MMDKNDFTKKIEYVELYKEFKDGYLVKNDFNLEIFIPQCHCPNSLFLLINKKFIDILDLFSFHSDNIHSIDYENKDINFEYHCVNLEIREKPIDEIEDFIFKNGISTKCYEFLFELFKYWIYEFKDNGLYLHFNKNLNTYVCGDCS